MNGKNGCCKGMKNTTIYNSITLWRMFGNTVKNTWLQELNLADATHIGIKCIISYLLIIGFIPLYLQTFIKVQIAALNLILLITTESLGPVGGGWNVRRLIDNSRALLSCFGCCQTVQMSTTVTFIFEHDKKNKDLNDAIQAVTSQLNTRPYVTLMHVSIKHSTASASKNTLTEKARRIKSNAITSCVNHCTRTLLGYDHLLKLNGNSSMVQQAQSTTEC